MSDQRLRELERGTDPGRLALERVRAGRCPWCGGPDGEFLILTAAVTSDPCCCDRCYDREIRVEDRTWPGVLLCTDCPYRGKGPERV